MKSPYVSELQPGQNVTGTFLVSAKDVRQKKSGDPFLSLILGDKTGEIDAKMWDNVEGVMHTFERSDFVRVTGLANLFQNRMQFTVQRLARIGPEGLDFGDFFPASSHDRGEMMAQLRGVIASVANPHLRALLESLFSDERIAARYQDAPAAKSIHHAWLGGLIEHVLSLCILCRAVAPNYPHIDVDLLLTGAIVHDIGKIEELEWERGFRYSDEGQLIGHIVQGLRIVDEAARRVPGFPPRLKTLVDHMILSHHGELGFGSPKVPVFAEALLLHHLDNLDSKMEALRAASEREPHAEGAWSPYIAAMERSALKKQKYLDPPPARAAAPPKPEPAGQQSSLFGSRLASALTQKD